MGILELMLGKSAPGEQGVAGQSYALPKDTHDFVYPVAVRRDEVEAFSDLLEAEAEAPSIEGGSDDLQAVFDGVMDDRAPDVDTDELAERIQRPRRESETVIETWLEGFGGDIDVVYARSTTGGALVAFVKRCKRRDETDDDPFELPENFPAVATLLKRLEDGTDTQYRAVVHTDLLPDE